MIRFTCCSDIHGSCDFLDVVGRAAIVNASHAILIAGDICSNAYYKDFCRLLYVLSNQAEMPVIFTPGNHDDFDVDKEFPTTQPVEFQYNDKESYSSVVCLVDRQISFHGINIFGSPWTKVFANWHWMKDLDGSRFFIPHDSDILLCHSPLYGYGDAVWRNGFLYQEKVGSKSMLKAVKSHKRISHVIYGHIHEYSGQSDSILNKNKKIVALNNVSLQLHQYGRVTGITNISFEEEKK